MNCRYCGTELPSSAMFCGECGRSVVHATSSVPVAVAVAALPPDVGPLLVPVLLPALLAEPSNDKRPEPLPVGITDSVPEFLSDYERVEAEHADTEVTRIVRRGEVGDRFVLQFSTGESQVVWGSGLLGRNPSPEPGQQFDHQISINDPGKSVSKTHLEFGQSAGAFWVCDRFSGNGTEIRQPNSERLRCDPGKRYLLARGSRIDIGDQFLIVS